MIDTVGHRRRGVQDANIIQIEGLRRDMHAALAEKL
jgi:hypothetical protein